MRAAILEGNGELVLHIAMRGSRNRDAVGFRQTFKTRGDIDAVAEDILPFDNDIADIDADAIPDALTLGNILLTSLSLKTN